jgi:tRNA pseudouridine55 synthase
MGMTRTERSGVLPVDKPAGPTSHDVVAHARRALGTRRIGHTGTLDPFATGLLLLCVNGATRIAEFLVGLDKTYTATMRLGVQTDTDDATGTVTAVAAADADPGAARVRAVLAGFEGTHLQTPPAYAARKVDGERMYKAARRGEAVDAPAVPTTIHAIRLLDYAAPLVTFEVHCGSGTYIRAIARDAGLRLGCGAHLTGLRRTAIADFRVEDAVPLDQLHDADIVARHWIEPRNALPHLPAIELDDPQAARIRHGQRLPMEGADEALPVLLLNQGRLLAVADRRDGVLHPRKVLSGE